MPTQEITRDLLGQELAQEEAEAEAGEVEVSEGDAGVGTDLGLEENEALGSKDQGADLALVGPGGDDERNNRDTIDDPNAQRLTWAEIEELKRKGGGSSGRVSRGSFFHFFFSLLFLLPEQIPGYVP